MAERALKDRLEPSLLDRLTDDDPGHRTEGQRRALSASALRESVRRDLVWLFNTTHLAALVPELTADPLAGHSVLNYGIPDLAGKPASGVNTALIERLLRQAIWDFEPRLMRNSVKVRLVVDDRQMSHNAMSFAIEAELWAQPLPLRLLLRTDIDLEDGSVRIADFGERGGA